MVEIKEWQGSNLADHTVDYICQPTRYPSLSDKNPKEGRLMMFVKIEQSITTFDMQHVRFKLAGLTLIERKVCCR